MAVGGIIEGGRLWSGRIVGDRMLGRCWWSRRFGFGIWRVEIFWGFIEHHKAGAG